MICEKAISFAVYWWQSGREELMEQVCSFMVDKDVVRLISSHTPTVKEHAGISRSARYAHEKAREVLEEKGDPRCRATSIELLEKEVEMLETEFVLLETENEATEEPERDVNFEGEMRDSWNAQFHLYTLTHIPAHTPAYTQRRV